MTVSARNGPDATALPFRLVCGLDALAHEVRRGLEGAGLLHDPAAALVLVLDAPTGNALLWLEANPGARSVVVTDNPCPEYNGDLLGHHPGALLAGGTRLEELVGAMRQVYRGQTIHKTAWAQSPLTETERLVLHWNARGLGNKAISSKLGLSEHTVRNNLHSLTIKLGLESRSHAVLYYWGLWHLIGR